MLLTLAAAALSSQLYLEREILRLADARCGLMSRGAHIGVAVGARQAERALREAGTGASAIAALNQEADAAAAALPCANPVLIEAAARAEKAHLGWANQWQVEFPGLTRPWVARRATDTEGFVLWQAGKDFRFGVRQGEELARLTLAAPTGDWRFATLSLRDPASPVPGKAVNRLTLPAQATAQSFLANGRERQPGRLYFFFEPQVALQIARLSPQEAIAIELTDRAGARRRLLVEAGDFASALTLIEAQGRRLH